MILLSKVSSKRFLTVPVLFIASQIRQITDMYGRLLTCILYFYM